jgi:hypothetical protein
MSQEKRPPSRLIHNPKPPTPPSTLSEEARLAAARDKANAYRHPDPPDLPAQARDEDLPVEMDEWGDLVSQRIEEAMRRGDFDNLRGQGKPLDLRTNPFVPEDQQMAFKLLENNNFTPDWIAERREVQRAIEQWRTNFQRVVGEAQQAWAAAQSDSRKLQVAERWVTWIVRWEGEIVELNRRIGMLNLKQPIAHLEIFKLRLDDELRQVNATRRLAD